MVKIIFNVVKRLIFAIILLYSLDLFLSLANIIIPINVISIIIVCILGIPGLLTLVGLFFLI